MLLLPPLSVATVLAVASSSVAWWAAPSHLPVSKALEACSFPGFEMLGRWWLRGSEPWQAPRGAAAAHSPGCARYGRSHSLRGRDLPGRESRWSRGKVGESLPCPSAVLGS